MTSENICMEIHLSNCLPDTSTLISNRLLTLNTSTTGLALFFQKSAAHTTFSSQSPNSVHSLKASAQAMSSAHSPVPTP
ncbi:unnamed protein product, partial [Rangifer tarandus platyrhynchus]